MRRDEWNECVRQHIALVAVGSSTLRRQVKEGGVEKARKFLKDWLYLHGLEFLDRDAYCGLLDEWTHALSKKLLKPHSRKGNWGAARKVLNIYLRMCAMNKDLHRAFNLKRIEPFLEVPLDSQVVKKIDEANHTNDSRGFRLMGLTRKASGLWQERAERIASGPEVRRYRYELDVMFWRQ